MGSGIGNRSLMQALGRVLGIEDVTQAPQFLKTDELVPTVNLDPGMAGYEQIQLQGQVSIDGMSMFIWLPFGVNSVGALTIGTAQYPDNAAKEIVILEASIKVAFTEAGRDAHIGNLCRLMVKRQAGGSAVSLMDGSCWQQWFEVDAMRTEYWWSFPLWQYYRLTGNDPAVVSQTSIQAASPIYIPAASKWGLELMYTDAGGLFLSNFPAGTLISVQAMAVACPKGMRPPGM